MRFMNEWDIQNAVDRWADHPVLGPASRTMANLMNWTNSNSDGWPYWSPPARAAAKLMEFIEGDGTINFFHGTRADATPERYKAALRPIKSFRTKRGADFAIEEVAA